MNALRITIVANDAMGAAIVRALEGAQLPARRLGSADSSTSVDPSSPAASPRSS